VTDKSSQSPARAQTPCPACGAQAERGQLICLECGSRIALRHRRPPSWKVPVGILAVVTVLAGAGAVLAYEAIDDEARREAGAAPPRVESAADKSAEPEPEPEPEGKAPAEQPRSQPSEPSLGTGDSDARDSAGADPADDRQPAGEQPAAADGELVPDGKLFTWPRDLEGFTVVVQSTEDRQSATTFANLVAQSNDGEVGVIDSADFRTVPRGFFVVFVGSYENRAGAQRAAARLGTRFQGSFPQAVRR